MRWFRILALVGLVATACSEATDEAEAGRATTQPPVADSITTTAPPAAPQVRVGAEVLADDDFAALAGQRVGLIANHTSTADGTHLIDLLDAAPAVELRAIFAPEHGVRGTAGAGELVDDAVDPATGVPVISLYTDNRAPTPEALADLDVLVYDLQDVGARFYTYISTMGLAMEAAAEAGVGFLVLDRPNPGGDTVGGFVLEPAQTSFIGQYPIPATYGLTAGELALLIQREAWLPGLDDLQLEVVEMQGWARTDRWADTGRPWVPPSPGLRSEESALVYPGTVLFEATTISFGGGTPEPFTRLGAPWADGVALARALDRLDLPGVDFEPARFTPRPIAGVTANPRLVGERLSGVRLVVTDAATFDPFATGVHTLAAFQDQAARTGEDPVIDRPETFDLLAGTSRLRTALASGVDPAALVAEARAEADAFAPRRDPVRLYP